MYAIDPTNLQSISCFLMDSRMHESKGEGTSPVCLDLKVVSKVSDERVRDVENIPCTLEV